jgi:hypothetical protein
MEKRQWLWTLKTMSGTVLNARKVIRDLKDTGRQSKLESTGTAYIWHSKQERNISIIKMIKRQICNDNEIQNLFSMMSVISLVFYKNIKYTVNGAENYTEFCSRNDRSELVSMRVGVGKLRGIRRGMEKLTCPLCMGNEDVGTHNVELHRNEECNI